MARPLRVEFCNACYHVMNRGLEHRSTFIQEADHARLLDLLDDIFTRWQVTIFAYCCMTTHYHLLLRTPLGNLSRIMRHLDGLYTQWFNRAHGRDGPLFRGRYRAVLIDADTHLLQVVRYIHLNPVEAGIARDPGAYSWSSHHLYRQGEAPRWLARDEILARFSDLREFERFTGEGNEESLTAFYHRSRYSPFLGNRSFTAEALRKARLSAEHPRAQRTPQFSTIADVTDFVCRRMDTRPDILAAHRRGRRNLARDLAVYIASRIAGFSHPAICHHFRLRSPSTVTKVCQRLEAVLSTTPALRQVIGQVTSYPVEGVPIQDLTP